MNRRIFLGALGLPLVARAARAQKPARVARIGFIAGLQGARDTDIFAGFQDELRNLGWVEGKNLVIEHRMWGADTQRMSAQVTELLGLKLDLIVVSGTPGALAAKAATSETPIVFQMVSDPVASGLVISLARPGGNVTGWSNMLPETSRKLLELLKEVVPKAARVAVLYDPTNPGKLLEIKVLHAEAQRTGLTLRPLEVRGPGEIKAAFATLTQERPDGLVTLQDGTMFSLRKEIVGFAAKARLPAIYQISVYVELGGLMSYGLNVVRQHRRGAFYVDRILRGARPGELPVEQPTAFELVVNTKAAKALGIAIPQAILLRADRAIE